MAMFADLLNDVEEIKDIKNVGNDFKYPAGKYEGIVEDFKVKVDTENSTLLYTIVIDLKDNKGKYFHNTYLSNKTSKFNLPKLMKDLYLITGSSDVNWNDLKNAAVLKTEEFTNYIKQVIVTKAVEFDLKYNKSDYPVVTFTESTMDFPF